MPLFQNLSDLTDTTAQSTIKNNVHIQSESCLNIFKNQYWGLELRALSHGYYLFCIFIDFYKTSSVFKWLGFQGFITDITVNTPFECCALSVQSPVLLQSHASPASLSPYLYWKLHLSAPAAASLTLNARKGFLTGCHSPPSYCSLSIYQDASPDSVTAQPHVAPALHSSVREAM